MISNNCNKIMYFYKTFLQLLLANSLDKSCQSCSIWKNVCLLQKFSLYFPRYRYLTLRYRYLTQNTKYISLILKYHFKSYIIPKNCEKLKVQKCNKIYFVQNYDFGLSFYERANLSSFVFSSKLLPLCVKWPITCPLLIR